MKTGPKNTVAMNRAGALCGCAALLYLCTRGLLVSFANLAISLRLPGATLYNPAGLSQTAAALARLLVSALSLAAPFLLARQYPVPGGLPLGRGRRNVWPRVLGIFWGMILAGNLLGSALARLGPATPPRVELPGGGIQLLLAWCAVCLLPAVGEELLFRGLLQGWLRPFGPLAAVLGQAVLFALLHGKASACLTALFGGLALGLAAEWCGSLRLGMALHLYNNTLAFAGQYAAQYAGSEAELLTQLALLLGAPLLAAFGALSLRSRGRLAKLASVRGGARAGWLLSCPGWLAGAGVLLALCVWQTARSLFYL